MSKPEKNTKKLQVTSKNLNYSLSDLIQWQLGCRWSVHSFLTIQMHLMKSWKQKLLMYVMSKAEKNTKKLQVTIKN